MKSTYWPIPLRWDYTIWRKQWRKQLSPFHWDVNPRVKNMHPVLRRKR